MKELIEQLQPPILVLGGSGFIGANIFRTIFDIRQDVYATASRLPSWRLDDIPNKNIIVGDLLNPTLLSELLNELRPRTLFDLIAYGAYSFEQDWQRIHETNYNLILHILEHAKNYPIHCYIHAGSSSEYGEHASGPNEDTLPKPNSHYSVSKHAASNLIHYYGQKEGVRCANLRLYSVYGPWEDSQRLIPILIQKGVEGTYPEFVNPDISRDFIYTDDVTEAFLKCTHALNTNYFGHSFNIGTGRKTTITELADIAKELFDIKQKPKFGGYENRKWDLNDWFANIDKSRTILSWEPRTNLKEGLDKTKQWYIGLENRETYHRSSKKFQLSEKYSVSFILVCEEYIPDLHELCKSLESMMLQMKLDYEIIIVCDTDNETLQNSIQNLCTKNRRILGIVHSRPFGEQASFFSGMEAASKNSCILTNLSVTKDLSVIEQFVEKWREGFDVIYGKPVFRSITSKLLHILYDSFTFLRLPLTTSNFCLIDVRVVRHMLSCKESTPFLKGIRSFVGFKQCGINLPPLHKWSRKRTIWRRMQYAKMGLMSFSNMPLRVLSTIGLLLFIFSCAMAVFNVVIKLYDPRLAPKGITTVLLYIQFFGSLNLIAVCVVAEYISSIFNESKKRPRYIREKIIKGGKSIKSF